MRLLFVCTGNLCRSPVAERLASAWLAQSSVSRGEHIEVLSAGTHAPVGEPMDRHSAAALARLGGDASGHRARILTPELAAGADLVLTMTRRHRRAVLELAPRGLRRTFTLLEAAQLIEGAEVRDLALLPLGQRVRELGLRLDARRAHRRAPGIDDIEDPIGRRASVHEEVAGTIAEALRPLLGALVPIPQGRISAVRPDGLRVRG
jgi:protein-tyrosine phosphatase